MLSGITIVCFAASYTVTLALEVSRLLLRAGARVAVMLSFAAAGLVAHTLHLFAMQARSGAGWYVWCLVAAWVLAAIYLGLALRRPRTATGLFLLPVVLALVGAARLVGDGEPFARGSDYQPWVTIHGVALLLGTIVVLLGFVAGVMYLVQSYRLKHKLPPRQGFQLPSLEWLQRVNSRSLVISSCVVVAGLISGIVLNRLKQGSQAGSLVWTSGVLLAWLAAAMLFEYLYKPARQGRKVAYLTVASFVFLGIVLVMVLLSGHAT